MKKSILIAVAFLLAACTTNTQSGGTVPIATPASIEDVVDLIVPAPSGEGTRFENGFVIIPQGDGTEKSVPVFEDPSTHVGETVLVYTNDNSAEVPTMGIETIPNGAQVMIIGATETTIMVIYTTVTYTLPSNSIVFIPAQ